jgi:hypothetical protein
MGIGRTTPASAPELDVAMNYSTDLLGRVFESVGNGMFITIVSFRAADDVVICHEHEFGLRLYIPRVKLLAGINDGALLEAAVAPQVHDRTALAVDDAGRILSGCRVFGQLTRR